MEFSATVTGAIVSGTTVSVFFLLSGPARMTSSTGKHGPAASPLHVHVVLRCRAPCRRSLFCSGKVRRHPGAERLQIACWVTRVVGSLYPRSFRNQELCNQECIFQALLIKSESRLHIVSTDFVTKASPRLGGALGQASVGLGGALGQG